MSGEQFIQQIGMKVLTRLTQIVEHFQAKGQIIDAPASSHIRMTVSTLIGYFVTKYAIAPNVEWDDQVEIDRMIYFLMKGLAPEN